MSKLWAKLLMNQEEHETPSKQVNAQESRKPPRNHKLKHQIINPRIKKMETQKLQKETLDLRLTPKKKKNSWPTDPDLPECMEPNTTESGQKPIES